MKAALFEKAHHLTVTQKTLRSLKNDEVMLKVSVCGVCGTDIHIIEGSSRSTPPVILGHEYAGIVTDVGSGVHNYYAGDAVAVDPNISCGTCYFCRRGEVHLCENLRALGVDIDGGMAESCIVPVHQLYRLPKSMPAEEAAFVEPLSCAVHGIDRAGIRLGDTVAIVGGGTVGLLLTQLAHISGASRVILVEPLEWKRKIAEKVGADLALDPNKENIIDAIRDLTRVGADVVIECVGRHETVALGFEIVRRGGTLELFGVCPIGMTVPFEPNSVYFKELTIVGSYVNPHTFDRSVNLMAEHRIRIEDFVVRQFPLDGVHEALKSLQEGTTIKSLINPIL